MQTPRDALSASLTLNLNSKQIQWLENACELYQNETGQRIGPKELLFHLISKGVPVYEAEMKKLCAKKKKDAPPSSHLRLIVSKNKRSFPS